jgi:hypothetical protein
MEILYQVTTRMHHSQTLLPYSTPKGRDGGLELLFSETVEMRKDFSIKGPFT